MENNNETQESPIQKETRKTLEKLEENKKLFTSRTLAYSKNIAIISGAVASLSATTILANIMIENYQNAIQNSGALISMLVYTIGNFYHYKYTKKEMEIPFILKTEEMNTINLLKNKLELLKTKCKQSQIQQATSTVAGVGFTSSLVASLFSATNDIEALNVLTVLSAALAGGVGILSFKTASKHKDNKNYYKLEKKNTEKELEVQLSKINNDEIVEETNIQKTLK